VGSLLSGLDPRRETRVTRLHERVTRGRFLIPGDGYRCVLGAGTARTLGLGLGDELVLAAPGRFGVLSAERCRLVGIITSGEMEHRPGPGTGAPGGPAGAAGVQGRITDFPLRVEAEQLDGVTARLRTVLAGQDLEVLRWHDMFPVMQEWAILHDGFLSLFDRVHEVGVLMALGNRGRDLALMMLTESLLIGLAGVLAGTLLGSALVGLSRITGIDLAPIAGDTAHFYVDPVIRPVLRLDHLGITVATVLAVTLLAGLYPAWRAGRLAPAQALRHV